MAEKLTKMVWDGTEWHQLELTAEELQQREADLKAFNEAEAIRQAEVDRVEALKVSARAKLVAGTKLTAEEAALLVI